MFFEIKQDIFPFTILVSYQDTDEQFAGFLNKYNLSADINSSLGNCYEYEGHIVVIRINTKEKVKKIIVHECTHATSMLFNSLNTPLHPDYTDEVYAYFNAFLYEKINQKITQKHKK